MQPQHRPCASDEENHTTHASNRATPAIHYDQTAHHDTKHAPQGDIAIKGSRHHHQHTPTHTKMQARHATMHTTTNHKQKQKSTLAHYRVLTQHTRSHNNNRGKMNLHNHPTQSQTAMKFTRHQKLTQKQPQQAAEQHHNHPTPHNTNPQHKGVKSERR